MAEIWRVLQKAKFLRSSAVFFIQNSVRWAPQDELFLQDSPLNYNYFNVSYLVLMCYNMSISHVVGNKAKGRISRRVFQENKACQIFRKTNISYPLIRTRTCAYQGVRNIRFSENLACLIFLKHPSWDSPFCLITDDV